MTATARPHDGDRIARLGLGIAAVVVTAQVAAHLVDYWAFDLRSVLLDSADEHKQDAEDAGKIEFHRGDSEAVRARIGCNAPEKPRSHCFTASVVSL